MKNTIAILLGTYNGEKYVTELIRSIQNQSFNNWVLFIRDDGSSDGTIDTIKGLSSQDARLVLLNDTHGRLGVAQNFSALLQKALSCEFKYYSFCDQDDVWFPNKLELLLLSIKKHEKSLGVNHPLLIHTDLFVVDMNLSPICPSFLKLQKIKHEPIAPLKVLLAQNFVTGCATIANHSLMKLVSPIPKIAVMHDWWAALCAAACGKIIFCNKPTMLYRQHDDNVVGAKKFSSLLNPFNMHFRKRWATGKHNYVQSIKQAGALRSRLSNYTGQINNDALNLCSTYASILRLAGPKRLKPIIGAGIHRQNLYFNILFMLRILFTSRKAEGATHYTN